MQSVKIGQKSNEHTKNGKFKSNFPNELQGVVFKKEFSKSIKILNKYRVFGNIIILYIVLIFAGFGCSVAGGILKSDHDFDSGIPSRSKLNKGSSGLIVGIVLIAIGVVSFFFGLLFTLIYAFTSVKNFKKNIEKELKVFNEKPEFKFRNIVWTLNHTSNKNLHCFQIVITFPSSIERLEEPHEHYMSNHPQIQNQNSYISTQGDTSYFNYDFGEPTFSSSPSSPSSSSAPPKESVQSSSTPPLPYSPPNESIQSPSTFGNPTFSQTTQLPSAPPIESIQHPTQPLEKNNIEMHSIEIDIDIDSSNNNNNNNNNNYTVKYCIKCTDHPDEILKLYCIECKIEICSDCTLIGESHYGHKYNKIK